VDGVTTLVQPGYGYPDVGDALTAGVIADSGLPAEQWERQERELLEYFRQAAARLPRRGALLDFGAGEGRLTPLLAPQFDRVVAVEPDPGRAAGHVAALADAPWRARVRLHAADPAGAEPTYDAAVCSHVIQHVPEETADAIVAHLSRVLRPGGLLLLTTCLSSGPRSRYAVDRRDAAGRVREEPATAAEFAAVCHANRPGELPVHFFPYAGLLALLRGHGLTPEAGFGLHGPHGLVGPLPVGGEPPPEDRRRLAACRDVAVLATGAAGAAAR